MYNKQFQLELDAALADSDDLTTGTPAERGRSVMESLGLSSPYLGDTKETRTQEQIQADRRLLAETAADLTPFVGGVKAATELPEDLAYAKSLIEQGYDESSLIKMGLGGAFTALSILGLLPGVKIGADIGKRTIKSQMDNLITPKRATQLEAAKKLPKGERRQYLKDVNRPVPKVFHGSPEMSKITTVTQDELDNTLLKIAKHTEINKNSLLDSLIDLDKYKPPKKKAFPKNSTPEQREKLRYEYEKNRIIAKNKVRKDRVSLDELLSGPSVYITKPVRPAGGKASEYMADEGVLSYEKMNPEVANALIVKVDGRHRGTIPIGADGKVSTQDVLENFNELNQAESRKSGLMDLAVQGMDEPASKAEKLVQEGFQSYDDFEGDLGLGRRQSRGEHMELDKKMLSTSRDPLVSLKEGFGEFNPANVVYADLPRRKVKGLSGADYTDARNYRDASKLSDEPLGLPKSDHLEAEIAVSKPEELNRVRRLSDKDKYVGPSANRSDLPEEFYSYRRMFEEGVLQGNKGRAEVADEFRAKEKKIINAVKKDIGKSKTLEEKVLKGQIIANSLKRREQLLARPIKDDYYFAKDMRETPSKKVIANKYYDDIKSYFNDLQSLGQFTEQYGARGTYDKFLEDLSKHGGKLNEIESNLFFIRRDLPKEKAENLRIIYNILKRRKTMPTNAESMSDTAGRGISNKQLLKSAKTETNLGIFKDAKVSLKGKDGTETIRERLPNMTGDSDFISNLDYNDLKRLLFLTTQKMNRGGLMVRK